MTQRNASNILAGNKKTAGTDPAFAAFAGKVGSQKTAQFAYEMKHGLRSHKYAASDPKTQAKKLLEEVRVLSLRKERDQAFVLLRKAIELDAENSDLHLQMGDMLSESKDTRLEALSSYMKALRIAPKDSKVYLCIGTLLMLLDREKEAIEYFEIAVALDPKNTVAVSRMLHLKAYRLDWSFWPQIKQYLKPFRGSKRVSDPFVFLPLVDDGQFQKERSAAMSNFRFENKNSVKLQRPEREPGAKIRIGYFSNDFYNHATMHLLGGLLQNHDRDQFEIYMYDYGSKARDDDHMRARDAADVFRDVRHLDGSNLAEVARRDMLDIALDLKGFTQGGRLEIFEKRVAPVQIAYLGYPGTTGLRAMDYMIADEVTVPSRLQKHFSEKILYMPHCYQPNDDSRFIAENGLTRTDYGLPEDGFVFASFNSPYKVTPAEFDIWMELLTEVEGSVLWFYRGDQKVDDILRAEAEKRGVDGARIITTGRLDPADHLARMRHADLFLDAFAVNAHTTASESLWAGVPMVTKLGDQFAARVAGSVLHAAGLDDLVAKSPQQYKAIALRMATDAEFFAAVKDKLDNTGTDCPLFDTVGYTRDFEALLEQAHERALAGKSPRSMTLS